MPHLPAAVLLGLALFTFAGCRSAMYSALEQVGIEKRDVLVDRVGDARDAQEAAKEQFTSALDQFRSVVKTDGGDLERTYDRLNAEYERSRARAEAVSERIEAVDQVAKDLFTEWKGELDAYSSDSLRRDSQRLLTDTQRRYSTLLKAMRRAESSMDPVLDIFEDQVLALKHNLNAQAIGSLREELASIEKQTSSLVREMERSITEANAFIDAMNRREGDSG